MDQSLEISRGQQAAELMEHPLLVEAFEVLRSQYLSAWETSPVRDAAGREELWRLMKSLSAVEGHLKTVAETGKLARLQVEQDSLMKRMRDGVLSRVGS